ncbi:MAG: M3 family oligoendopeptidase [Sphaerochaeta sp.]|nr:M3 family oligoendopeptidase [Sphaerochaeta sp.]
MKPEVGKPKRRRDIPTSAKWDTTRLYASHDSWLGHANRLRQSSEATAQLFVDTIPTADTLVSALDAYDHIMMEAEKLRHYAFLNHAVDSLDHTHRKQQELMLQLDAAIEEAWSFLTPSILVIPEETLQHYYHDSPHLRSHCVRLERIRRLGPHTLDRTGQQIMSAYGALADASHRAFSALVQTDMSFGKLDTPEGPKALDRSNLSWFLRHPDRTLRARAYHRYLGAFDTHKHALATIFRGSIHQDIYQSKVHHYASSREMVLYPDAIDESVHSVLIESIRMRLSTFHDYFALKRQALGLDRLKPYDLFVPIVKASPVHIPYDEAVGLVCASVSMLGRDFCDTLEQGLLGGWVDRYGNVGKHSGSFTASCYLSDPAVLLNYKENVLQNLFTLAHEGAHAMHTWYSIHHNPFSRYAYSILEAETVANVHERLLASYLIDRETDVQRKAYLLEQQVEGMLAKLLRQTMLADFEHQVHCEEEAGRPLTLESMRSLYRDLLVHYYGPDVDFDPLSDLEFLTIGHFYQAYYVYTYPVGAASSLVLADKLAARDPEAIERYLALLKRGGSRYPVDSLAAAGGPIGSSETYEKAMDRFAQVVAAFARSLEKLPPQT